MKETFGQRLSRLRKEKGLTQEEIASKITISPQAVSKWENDISSPDILYLSSLADILGVSVDELLGRGKTNASSSNNETKTEEVKDEEFNEEEFKKDFTGDRVAVDNTGVHVTDDEGQSIHVSSKGVEFINEDGTVVKEKKFKDYKPHSAGWIISSIVATFALVGYILMGLLWKDNNIGWKMGWILFLLVPIASSIEMAIRHRKITSFAYPVLVVAVYCTLGFLGLQYGFKGFEFYWFLFLTVPAYYAIFEPIDKYVFRKNNKKR